MENDLANSAIKAFVRYDQEILILRESGKYIDGTNVGRYDVPGGRIKKNEKWKDGFLREICEETGLVVRIGKPFDLAEWWPRKNGDEQHVVATFIECFADSNLVDLTSNPDHDNYEWINPIEFRKYPLIENLIPIFESYLTK